MTPRPLIAIDADVLGRQRTGDEAYIANLLAELPAAAPELHFVAITRHPDLVPEGIEPVELQAGSQTYRMSVTLPRLLQRLEPNLAHFQYAIPLGFRRRSVVTVHDLSFEAGTALTSTRDRFVFRRAVRRSVRRADAVFTGSEFTRSQLQQLYGLDTERISVQPYGFNSDFSPHDPAPIGSETTRAGRPYALFVGTLHPRKDPLSAVEAISLAQPPLDLIMVGPNKGSETAIRAAIKRLSLTDRVTLRGHVSTEELAVLYRNAACLVFPSLYEGFGLPILEAMASGTPVVAARTTSIPEVAGDAAILVEPGRPAALAGGIERAVADRQRLVPLGLERATHFSWKATAQLAADVYRKLAA